MDIPQSSSGSPLVVPGSTVTRPLPGTQPQPATRPPLSGSTPPPIEVPPATIPVATPQPPRPAPPGEFDWIRTARAILDVFEKEGAAAAQRLQAWLKSEQQK